MGEILSDAGMDLLFRKARTHNVWQDGGIGDALLAALYELAKMGPTSANCSPMRIVFVKSREAKDRLKPFLDDGNVQKTMVAPVTAIIAYDMKFHDLLPTLFPHTNARSWFAGDPEKAAITAFRNGSLQGAYFIIAARAVGLDCGPMSGFDNAKLDKEFFPDGRFKSNFLCNLGHGDPAALKPRDPRLSFDDACSIV
jgi:3-hydroxypropanoate dehydrogenase